MLIPSPVKILLCSSQIHPQTTLTPTRETEQQWACISIELFSPTHTLCIQHTVKKKSKSYYPSFFVSGWWWSNFKGSGVLCCVEGILRDSLLCCCQAAHTLLITPWTDSITTSKLTHADLHVHSSRKQAGTHFLSSAAIQRKRFKLLS